MRSWLVAVLLLSTGVASSQQQKEERKFPRRAIDLPSGSGNDFLRLCSMVERNQKMEDTVQDLVCTSYIAGLRDGVASEVAFAQSENKSAPKPFCLSVGVENGQLVKIALKYIKNHPEWAHLPTSVLLVKAWEEAFPCR